ncbi:MULTISPECIES: hypothetical protein [Terrisporobacter]|nr:MULTISPECIES: hypothetical protein [Terrisporobacter]
MNWHDFKQAIFSLASLIAEIILTTIIIIGMSILVAWLLWAM